jgi:hypothetical protein
MKKLLLMLLMASILPFGMVYGENIAADGSSADTFVLSHVVARISTFTTKKLSSVINDGTNIIGKFEVENNTSDGYKVNIKSTNLGNMVLATTVDGEQDRPYVVNADKLDGEVGAGMVLVIVPVDLSLATGTDLIELGGGAEQTSGTDASFKMTVTVDDADAMSMAGSYSDTITVTYTDL